MALEVTVSSVKSTDVTCKTYLGQLAAQLLWLVNLASLVCDMNKWFSCWVWALQPVVASLISSGGDHRIHYWWDLISSNSCPVFPYVVRRCSIHNINPLLKKGKCKSISVLFSPAVSIEPAALIWLSLRSFGKQKRFAICSTGQFKMCFWNFYVLISLWITIIMYDFLPELILQLFKSIFFIIGFNIVFIPLLGLLKRTL